MSGVLRVVITGSRNWSEPEKVHAVLDELLSSQQRQIFLAHGGARGVDRFAHAWCTRILAQERGTSISAMRQITDKGDAGTRVRFRVFQARWGSKEAGTFDRAAGFKRNERMIVEHRPELTLAFIENNSGGATQCAQKSILSGIATIVFRNTGVVNGYNIDGPTDTEARLSNERPYIGPRLHRGNVVY